MIHIKVHSISHLDIKAGRLISNDRVRIFEVFLIIFFTNLQILFCRQGAAMDVDDEEDPVPEITKKHFEESMKFARRYIYFILM